MLTASLSHAWTPLAAAPLLWLVVILGSYAIGQAVQRFCRGSAIVNPVLVAMVVVGTILEVTGTSYEEYFSGAQLINFLLGPVTIALAVPLANNFTSIGRIGVASGWRCSPGR